MAAATNSGPVDYHRSPAVAAELEKYRGLDDEQVCSKVAAGKKQFFETIFPHLNEPVPGEVNNHRFYIWRLRAISWFNTNDNLATNILRGFKGIANVGKYSPYGNIFI